MTPLKGERLLPFLNSPKQPSEPGRFCLRCGGKTVISPGVGPHYARIDCADPVMWGLAVATTAKGGSGGEPWVRQLVNGSAQGGSGRSSGEVRRISWASTSTPSRARTATVSITRSVKDVDLRHPAPSSRGRACRGRDDGLSGSGPTEMFGAGITSTTTARSRSRLTTIATAS